MSVALETYEGETEALREPSEAVLKAAAMHYGDLRDLLIVAVAAAEQAVQGE